MTMKVEEEYIIMIKNDRIKESNNYCEKFVNHNYLKIN